MVAPLVRYVHASCSAYIMVVSLDVIYPACFLLSAYPVVRTLVLEDATQISMSLLCICVAFVPR